MTKPEKNGVVKKKKKKKKRRYLRKQFNKGFILKYGKNKDIHMYE